MSARSHTPDSFTSPLFEFRRQPGKIYDELTELFKHMGPTAVANAEYGTDFFRQKYGNEWSTHFCYVDGESQEYTGNLFGEVLGDIHGTAVGAQGNHFAGNDRSSLNQITDSAKTRCNIVLGCPSFAPSDLKDLWHNQLCTLRTISHRERSEDQANFIFLTSVKEIVKELISDYHVDAITLTGPLLYTVPQREHGVDNKQLVNRDNVTAKLKKRKLDHCDSAEDFEEHSFMNKVNSSLPGDSDVVVGAQYDYKLMPDYDRRIIHLNKARLIQPDWRKLDNGLIVPWKSYLQLRPGTVVVANVSFRLHVLQPKDTKQQKRKVYQAIVNFLKVVAESDIPVNRPVPPLTNKGQRHRAILPADDSAISILRSIGFTHAPSGAVNVSAVGAIDAPSKETAPDSAKRLRRTLSTTSGLNSFSPGTYIGHADRTDHGRDLSSLEYIDLNNSEDNSEDNLHMAMEEDDENL
ncbi:hypothetical protein F5879DRAFT_992920 [Lentinula edodes]|nr:hypothetical protein F5879DRAFT_992920 [Lentinula edodes]